MMGGWPYDGWGHGPMMGVFMMGGWPNDGWNYDGWLAL